MSGAGAGASGAAVGGQLEEKVDLSTETTAKIEQSQQLPLPEALVLLFALEKRCRVGNDNASLVRVCEECVKHCRKAGDEEALLNTLSTLSTRRSQKTAAVRALVLTALPWCVVEPYKPVEVQNEAEREFRLKLVESLRTITDGKIFLERERAQLTRALAAIKEEEGDTAGAADVLQEVHVETYGSLSKRDKVEFILEQMRLCLAKRDYIRSAIVAGKIKTATLREEGMQEYKTKYYQLLSALHRHDKAALELAKDYHSIYSTPDIMKDEGSWTAALQSTVLFLALAPYSSEQQDMMNRIATDVNLEKLPECQYVPVFHRCVVPSWRGCFDSDLTHVLLLLLFSIFFKCPQKNRGNVSEKGNDPLPHAPTSLTRGLAGFYGRRRQRQHRRNLDQALARHVSCAHHSAQYPDRLHLL